METKHTLSDLTDLLKMSAGILQSTVEGLPKEERAKFDDELIKQGFDEKMGELNSKMQELKNLSKKY